jgi:pimeloyl-[acyl-carrier protein] methyl ester esterase
MNDLYIEINGTGPDLVLLHGWGLNVRVWDGLVEELRDRFRLIAIDLPGHGRSPWSSGRNTPAEQAWLIHSTLTSVSNHYSLLGWSLGAQIALDLSAAMPAQVDRLVLVAATPRFTQSVDWPYGMRESVVTRMAAQLRDNYRQTVSDFLELQVRGSVQGASALEQLRKALLVHGEAKLEALEAGLTTLSTTDLRATLAHVKAPALVIAGQHDRITPPAASSALARALPDATYVEMRRAAHAPFLSSTAEFAKLVSQFLTGAVETANAPVAVGKPAASGTATLMASAGSGRTGEAAARITDKPLVLNAKASAPSAGAPTPSAKPLAPSAKPLAPSAKAPTPGAKAPAPSAKALAPSAKAPALSGKASAASAKTSASPTQRRAKKKRMKARARKKLWTASR